MQNEGNLHKIIVMEGHPYAFEANRFIGGANLQVMKNEHGLFRHERLPNGHRSAVASPSANPSPLPAAPRPVHMRIESVASEASYGALSISGSTPASPPQGIGLMIDPDPNAAETSASSGLKVNPKKVSRG